MRTKGTLSLHLALVAACMPPPNILMAEFKEIQVDALDKDKGLGIDIKTHCRNDGIDVKLKQLFQTADVKQEAKEVVLWAESQKTIDREREPIIYREKRQRRWEKRYTPPRKSNNRFKH